MYTSFNLSAGNNDLDKLFKNNRAYYFQRGKQLLERNTIGLEKSLNDYIVERDLLDGATMEDDWFPSINADIFLSHSHKDEELVIALAGWLDEKCGVKAFVDSCVWGYSDKLLKKLDDKYCRKSSSETYDYQTRNVTTSHVHMMLNSALAKMMDKTECLFFINTNNAINVKSYFNDSRTYSPWIYSEVNLSHIIRKKSKDEHRMSIITESMSDVIKHSYNLQIAHRVSLEHMTPISCKELESWANRVQGHNLPYPLDSLYALMGIKEKVLNG